jgi:hypothetical protein
MKIIPFALCSALLFAFHPASAASAADRSAPSQPGTLQVQVNVPPSWQPMFEDRVADAFADYIIDAFKRRGFGGRVVQVNAFDEPSPGCCLLVIDLTEWRMNHIGNIDCSFVATLQTDRVARSLGVFSGMAFRWMSGPGRFGLSDAFGDAAQDAIRQLYDALARTELVPGIRRA